MSSALISLLCLGACLVQRTWAPMGGHHKPSLLAWPSPVVPLGGHVTLRCQFPLPFATFKLFRREGTRGRELQRHRSNSFTIDPMSVAHAGFYACSVALCHSCEWSAHSNPLQIVVTGVLRRPSISAQPSPLVHAGVSVTLCCHSRLIFDTFILHREGGTQYSQQHREKFSGVHSQARFSMGPLTPARGGTYRCYGTLSHAPQEWSAPSDPVDVAVTGKHEKPHLSALLGSAVRSAGNVTLLCGSESSFDVYHLCRAGHACPRRLAAGRSHSGASQAAFPLGPGTPAQEGAYTCYGSFNHSPHEWSAPSDPVHLSVPETTESTCPSPGEPSPTDEAYHPQEDTDKWYILTGLSATFISTGIFLAVLVCLWCSTKKRAAMKSTGPEEDPAMDGEDPEDTQDVIYAQLDPWILSQGFRATSLRPTGPSVNPAST
ncbi:putative killer cell immunoglobulin-like receptor-like protein KIR3DX1 isoform X1 [Manis javanica]|uniref:putative killer cell immunoglobulin-like receptor-like protein KIR3DX1 isoform X1 n=1 Tax=Manis javanica TaxID=9974 RepID=UPI003C6CC51F